MLPIFLSATIMLTVRFVSCARPGLIGDRQLDPDVVRQALRALAVAALVSPRFAGAAGACCAEAELAISAAARAIANIRLTMSSPRKAAQRRGVSGPISRSSIASGLMSMAGAGISDASSLDRPIGSIRFSRASGVIGAMASGACRVDGRGLNRPVVHDWRGAAASLAPVHSRVPVSAVGSAQGLRAGAACRPSAGELPEPPCRRSSALRDAQPADRRTGRR